MLIFTYFRLTFIKAEIVCSTVGPGGAISFENTHSPFSSYRCGGFVGRREVVSSPLASSWYLQTSFHHRSSLFCHISNMTRQAQKSSLSVFWQTYLLPFMNNFLIGVKRVDNKPKYQNISLLMMYFRRKSDQSLSYLNLVA